MKNTLTQRAGAAFLLTAALFTLGQIRSSAQIINPLTTQFVSPSGSEAPGDGNDYVFYGTGGTGYPNETNTAAATSYAITNFGNVQGAADGISTGLVGLPASGTPPTTVGVGIIGGGNDQIQEPGNPSNTVLTFQVVDPSITSFNVYLLTNAPHFGGQTYTDGNVTLATGIGTLTPTYVTRATGPSSPELLYTEFQVTNVSAGETFYVGVQGTPVPNQSFFNAGTLNAITFESNPPAAAPEPSTYALLFGALAVLMYMRRRSA